ncbi:hypothetical protein K1719_037381 [Acacia pycnantha]|nr:hypothetical protein K1719_037381 [Acacia pycnantha]
MVVVEALRNPDGNLWFSVSANRAMRLKLSSVLRVKNMDGLKIYVTNDGRENRRTTTNVVYKKFFGNLGN